MLRQGNGLTLASPSTPPLCGRCPRRHRQGTLAKSAQGGSCRTGTPAQRRRLTWATLVPHPPSQSPSRPEHWWGSAGAPGPPAWRADPAQPSGGAAAQPGSPCPFRGRLASGSPIYPRTGRPRPLTFTETPQSSGVGGEALFALDPVNGGSQSCVIDSHDSRVGQSGEALSGRRMLSGREAVPLGSETGDEAAASLCPPTPALRPSLHQPWEAWTHPGPSRPLESQSPSRLQLPPWS